MRRCNAIGGGARQVVIIADQAVADLHLQGLAACLPTDPLVLTFPPGEASKSVDTVQRLYAELARACIERGATIVTFGGGVAGDLGGFVAATWLRGVRYVQVSTTLLSAVDASVGGKTGVNLPRGKNLVGAFHQPETVIIDTEFLQTLSDRDFTSGLAESVKHAVVLDPAFLAWHRERVDALRARDEDAVAELIARNCELKAKIVVQDEREAGLRAVLNHGHTVGHAIEHLLEYRLRHGECVALGMVAENELACNRGLLDPVTSRRIGELLSRLGLPTRLPYPVDADDVIQACRLDKKARGGAFNFVLIRQIGGPVQVTDVSEAELARALRPIQPP